MLSASAAPVPSPPSLPFGITGELLWDARAQGVERVGRKGSKPWGAFPLGLKNQVST